MNSLHVGFKNEPDLPKGGYLLITDELWDIPRSKIFDPLKHSFNPLARIDEDGAEEMAELLYTLTPGGSETLTARNGRLALARALVGAGRFDKVDGNEEVALMRDSVLFSPTRQRVLCEPPNFKFSPDAKIQARVNRGELGEKSALVLGLLLMNFYKGQLVVPDFGFYGRDIHSRLIHEDRLVAGVKHLEELPAKLRKTVLLIDEKIPMGATVEDAEELAKYVRPALGRNSNKYLAFIEDAIG